jgi:hypothetical protein
LFCKGIALRDLLKVSATGTIQGFKLERIAGKTRHSVAVETLAQADPIGPTVSGGATLPNGAIAHAGNG